MAVYAALKIREGDYVIQCPDANCDCKGELTLEEMESLVGSELYQQHLRFRKNKGEAPPTYIHTVGQGHGLCVSVVRLCVYCTSHRQGRHRDG